MKSTMNKPDWAPKWVLVTPQKAKVWLSKNPNNRPQSVNANTSYALDMKNDNWIPNHQGIAFNNRDVLIDGQSRLQSIIESGKSIWMLVSYGLHDEHRNGITLNVMDTVDRGRIRSVGQSLGLFHGYSNGNRIAAIATALVDYIGDVKWRRLTLPQTLHVLKIYDKSVAAIYGLPDANKRMPAYIGGPIVALHHVQPEAAMGFAVRFVSMEGLEATSPVLALIRWQANNKGRHTDTFRKLAIKTTATCLYHFKHGHAIKKVTANEAASNWVRDLQAENIRKIRKILNLADDSDKKAVNE